MAARELGGGGVCGHASEPYLLVAAPTSLVDLVTVASLPRECSHPYAQSVTDEQSDAKSRPTDSSDEDAEADRRMREMVIDEYCQDVVISPTAEELALLAALTVFAKAFLETLGRRAGDGLADLVRARPLRRGKTTGALVSVDDAAATIVITTDLPDEARLALLDLDVTAEELRGMLLHWDRAAGAWCPVEAPQMKMDEASPGLAVGD